MLKFAALVRVSTVGQKEKGESIRTQTKRIEMAAQLRGDKIVRWYKGQEHASAEHERKLLDQMLSDSSKGIFNAVIVDDPSRWSRDNVRSKSDLEILRANSIRFFAGGIEYDLFNPNSYSLLNLQTEMNELFATTQAYKSITNKIERAKRGTPTSGKLPYGRTFDRANNKWGIDPEKHKLIRVVAEEYCKGESIRHLAKRFGVNASSLHKTLLYRCGDTWTEKFESKKFGIKAEVTHKIPRLLSENAIRRLKEATAAKKTYLHREKFRKYLLSRMIFCADCGLACFGATNHGQQFYRHSRSRPKTEWHFQFISAKRIENAVLEDVFSWFGGANVLDDDKQTIEDKVSQIQKERKKIGDKIDLYTKELKSIGAKQDNIVKAIESGLPLLKLKDKAVKLNAREEEVKVEVARLNDQLKNFMTPEELKEQLDKAKSVKAQLQRRMKKGYLKTDAYKKGMSFDEKKKLFLALFGGIDSEGKRLGIYVRQHKGTFHYEIRGIFKSIEGVLLDKDHDSFLKQGMLPL